MLTLFFYFKKLLFNWSSASTFVWFHRCCCWWWSSFVLWFWFGFIIFFNSIFGFLFVWIFLWLTFVACNCNFRMMKKTIFCMIVDHSNSLHKCVNCCLYKKGVWVFFFWRKNNNQISTGPTNLNPFAFKSFEIFVDNSVFAGISEMRAFSKSFVIGLWSTKSHKKSQREPCSSWTFKVAFAFAIVAWIFNRFRTKLKFSKEGAPQNQQLFKYQFLHLEEEIQLFSNHIEQF